jgi:curved DNA-binding protein CbpA
MTILRPRSLYDVLNVSVEAEPVVIEAAYKALMKKYHPDQKDEARISRDAAQINEAYATLKDPTRRAEYDHRLWTRDEVLRAAAVDSAPARPSRLFGWTGWALAALLGCATLGFALGRDAMPLQSPALAQADARVPEAAVPQDKPGTVQAVFGDDAMNPAADQEPDVAEALPAAATAAAALAPQAAPAVVTQTAKPAPRAQARPVRTARVAPTRWSRPAARPAPQRRTGRPAEVKDKAFLEREGYIY